jgi:hypothetical protein
VVLVDDKVDWKKAAAEGAISGATGAIMPGAAAAKNAAKAAKTTIGQEATEAAVKPSLLSKFSNNLTKSGSGLKVGNNVGDVERLDQAAETFQRLKIAGTPEQQLRKINDTMKVHSSQVDDILSKNPIVVNGADVKAQVAKAIDDPLKYADLDLTTMGAQKHLNTHLEKFAKATTAKEVNDYVKVLNKTAANAQGKLARGASLTDKETAALAAKKAGDEVLSQFPEIKPLKQDMAILFERNPQVAKESERAVGIPILGVKSKALKQGADSVASNTGNLLTKFNRGGTSNIQTEAAKGIAAQGAARSLTGVNADQPENMPMSQNSPATTSDTTTMPASISNMPQLNTDSVNDANNIDYEAEAQKALASGDYKAFDAILSLAALAEKKATSGVNKPLSAEASKVIATANSGLGSLSQLEAMIAEGGVPKGTTVPGRGLFGGAGQAVLGTSSFDAAADNVADAMVRARTGAAATKEELALYRRLLPQAFDAPEVQAQKMQTVRNYFSSIANRTGSAGTDLQELAGAQL